MALTCKQIICRRNRNSNVTGIPAHAQHKQMITFKYLFIHEQWKQITLASALELNSYLFKKAEAYGFPLTAGYIGLAWALFRWSSWLTYAWPGGWASIYLHKKKLSWWEGEVEAERGDRQNKAKCKIKRKREHQRLSDHLMLKASTERTRCLPLDEVSQTGGVHRRCEPCFLVTYVDGVEASVQVYGTVHTMAILPGS